MEYAKREKDIGVGDLLYLKLIEFRLRFKSIKLALNLINEFNDNNTNSDNQQQQNVLLKTFNAVALIYSGDLNGSSQVLSQIDLSGFDFDFDFNLDYKLNEENISKRIKVNWLNQQQIRCVYQLLNLFCVKGVSNSTITEQFNNGFNLLKMSTNNNANENLSQDVDNKLWDLKSMLNLNLYYTEHLILSENFQLAKKICLNSILLIKKKSIEDDYLNYFIYLLALYYQSLANFDKAKKYYECLLEIIKEENFKISIYLNLISMQLDQNKQAKLKVEYFIDKIDSSEYIKSNVIESKLYYFKGIVNEDEITQKNYLNYSIQLMKMIQNQSLQCAAHLSLAKIYYFKPQTVKKLLGSILQLPNPTTIALISSYPILLSFYSENEETYSTINNKYLKTLKMYRLKYLTVDSS
ncbi:hypothetical protein K502DRAFT_117700 [Neoconidiobolus thromboides FSU 785]|nr:hypothetical protein K502DRAFT_117700 [Neoconidiobolus thromboides FSU 785]